MIKINTLKKCSLNECELDAYNEEGECVLHCKKENDKSQFMKPAFLNKFNDELIEYIVSEFYAYKTESESVKKEEFKSYLKEGVDEGVSSFPSFISEAIIVLTNIVFPNRKDKGRYDYIKVLNCLDSIHFNYCEFSVKGLVLNSVKCFYQDCVFYSDWNVCRVSVLEIVSNVLFQNCMFHGDVNVLISEDEKELEIYHALFRDCLFKGSISCDGINFKKGPFNNTISVKTEIGELSLFDCTIDDVFVLNNCSINVFRSADTLFNSKFEFKNNIVNKFDVFNSNYFKIVDTYGTKYGFFSIKKCIFEDFVSFEDCEFGLFNGGVEYITSFVYTTCLSFVNFRGSTFVSGLDIEAINLKEPPNFLNANISSGGTNRETFRIIKNSFDKVGNNIEANKYFIFEMTKYKEELVGSGLSQEKIVFYLNEKISGFGRSYIKPIGWILLSSILYYLLVLGHENNMLYKIYPPANTAIKEVSDTINNIVKHVVPFKKVLLTGMEFISFIFYAVFTSLTWQVVVAIKRHTKR